MIKTILLLVLGTCLLANALSFSPSGRRSFRVLQQNSDKGATEGSNGSNFSARACPRITGVSHFACTQEITPGCVGYSNGTYKYRNDSNGCKLCADANVTSFNPNQSCPAAAAAANASASSAPDYAVAGNFTPESCPHIIGVSHYACTQEITPGCVGYKNGTYENRNNSNKCKLCAEDNVTSFNANQSCPAAAANASASSAPDYAVAGNFTPESCPHIIGVSHYACTQEITPGCVGYKNGTYENRNDSNGCKLCGQDNVTSFNANQSCPAATNATTQPDEAKVGSFTPQSCPHIVGVSDYACTQEITPGCVGYNNGTYQYRNDSNGCKLCAGDNVKSFNANEACPE